MENYYLGRRSPITLALALGRPTGHLGSNSEEEVVAIPAGIKRAWGAHKPLDPIK